MNKILPALFKFLEISPIILAVVLPLLFIPVTTEYFETAKVSFFYIFTALVFVVWGIKMVYDKRVTFVRSPLDVAMAGLAVVFALTVVFSPNKYLAVFGSYLRYTPSLAFVVALVVWYYTASSNLKNKILRELVVVGYVLSVAAAAALALLAYFAVFTYLPLPAPLAFLQSNAFNTVGSLSGLAVLAGVAFVLALSLTGQYNNYKNYNDYKSYIPVALNVALFPLLAIVLAYGTLSGWAALVVGLALLAVFDAGALQKAKQIIIPLGIWAVLLLAVIFTPQASKALRLTRPAEISLPLAQSWQIASQTITTQPIFGAGLGQFPHMFTALKPLSFNNLPIWNLRFDRPFNEILLILAEAGIVGVAAYFLLFARVLSLTFGLKNKESLGAGLAAASLALVSALLVTAGSSTLYVSLFLLAAILVAMEEQEGSRLAERVVVMISTIKDKLFGTAGSAPVIASAPLSSRGATPRGDLGEIASGRTPRNDGKSGVNQILPYLMLGVAVLTGVFGGAATVLAYAAEVYNRNALNAVAKNDGKAAFDNEVKAIAYNPYVDVYQRNLAQIAMGVAVNLSSRPNVTDADKQTVQNLIQESIRRARVASEIIDPASVSNWETRAQIYQGLMGVAANAEQWTVDAYTQAVRLDPANPNLRILLGGVYYGMGSFEAAGNSFAQAINLKPDIANAHYNLAQALIKLNRKADALSQYDIVLNLIGTASADFAKAKQERDGLARQVASEANDKGQMTNDQTGATPQSQEKLQVQTPKPALEKQKVTPPAIDLGTPKESSPAANN